MKIVKTKCPKKLDQNNGSAFTRVFFLHLFAIATYAICYYRYEPFAGEFEHFGDALYFSATTWTTLGYGDISPVGVVRLLTSFQALSGLLSLAVLASVVWLYCERRFRSPGRDEQAEEDYGVLLDGPYGLFRPIESEKYRKEQAKRDRLRLEPCALCEGIARVEKYYDIIGRTTPLPKFVACCTSCGALVKPQANAYLAAWSWNRDVRQRRR